MSRITAVHVNAYRGLRDLTLEGLEDISVLIGPSNTGKTSLLEAVWLAASPQAVGRALGSVLSSRGIAGAASLNALFPNQDSADHIEIRLHLAEGEEPERLTFGLQPADTANNAYTEVLSQKQRQPTEFQFLQVSCTLTNHERNGSFRLQIGVRESDGLVDPGLISSGKTFGFGRTASFFFQQS